MGRGRAKAKQTKVARDLKYNSGAMDLNRLRADLIHEDANGDVDPELLAKYEDLAFTEGSAGADDSDSDDSDDDEGSARD